MVIAQLDLTNGPTGFIDLAGNYPRTIRRASRGPAGTLITASPARSEGRRERIEVGFEHYF